LKYIHVENSNWIIVYGNYQDKTHPFKRALKQSKKLAVSMLYGTYFVNFLIALLILFLSAFVAKPDVFDVDPVGVNVSLLPRPERP